MVHARSGSRSVDRLKRKSQPRIRHHRRNEISPIHQLTLSSVGAPVSRCAIAKQLTRPLSFLGIKRCVHANADSENRRPRISSAHTETKSPQKSPKPKPYPPQKSESHAKSTTHISRSSDRSGSNTAKSDPPASQSSPPKPPPIPGACPAPDS